MARYFSKPCNYTALAELLVRLASFREIISNHKVRRIIGGIGALPGPPETFLKIEKVLQSPVASMQDVAEVVEQDVAVTAKLLQIVNSAEFGIRHKVVSITEAVQLADRIIVMTYRPGRLKRMVDIDLPRPRTSEIVSSEAFGRYVAQIWSDLREEASRGMRDDEEHMLHEHKP